MSLAAYLDENKLSCTEFARRLGVEDSTVWRWRESDLNPDSNDGRRPSLSLALKIEKLTGGAVPVSCWADTARKVRRSRSSRKGPSQRSS